MTKKKHRLLPIFFVRVYIFSILIIFIVFSINNNRIQKQSAVPRKPQCPVATVFNPIDPKTVQLSDKYLKQWRPEFSQSLVTSTTTHKGINIKNVNSPFFTNENISAITNIIDTAPQALIDFRPQNIFFTTFEMMPNNASNSGVAKGPNIYLLPSAFERDDLSHTFLHEWVHVVQYYKTIAEIEASSRSQFLKLHFPRLIRSGSFVHDYAIGVGWSSPTSTVDWTLATDFTSQTQTRYGKTLPEEDMAESVSRFLIGDSKFLSPARVNWVKNFLGCK